ncbi:MAG TPA: rhomboid family intramembrane serine protease [Thermomicrobiaceae bacterium]|nr:rhomboid family intramembrane serine protease [Thermomicrobiaceae bacterium]
MLPYADEPEVTRRAFPIVNVVLIALNVIVFIYELELGQAGAERFILRWGFIPADFWAGAGLLTIVTALFIHAGLLHIGGNLLYLWVFGDNVEDQLGHVTYLIFYLLAGIVGNIGFAVAFSHTGQPLIGASGAIAGVLGGYLLLYPRAIVRTVLTFGPFITLGGVAAVIVIGFWFVLQVIESLVSVLAVSPSAGESGVAFFAHVSGFIFGLIATGVIREARDQQLTHWHRERWWSRSFRNWALLALVATVVGIAGQLIIGHTGEVVRTVAGGVLVAIALLDGIGRLRGNPALLGTVPRTHKLIAILQILAALSLAGAVIGA